MADFCGYGSIISCSLQDRCFGQFIIYKIINITLVDTRVYCEIIAQLVLMLLHVSAAKRSHLQYSTFIHAVHTEYLNLGSPLYYKPERNCL